MAGNATSPEPSVSVWVGGVIRRILLLDKPWDFVMTKLREKLDGKDPEVSNINGNPVSPLGVF